MTSREMQERIENLESDVEGLKLTLAEVVNGSRIVAVSERPGPDFEGELHSSAAWSSKRGPVHAKHSSSCRGCNGKIWKGDSIVEVDPKSYHHLAGEWVHAECAP